LHWIQIGGAVGRPVGRLGPFGGLTARIAILHPRSIRLHRGTTHSGEDTLPFAFTPRLGLKGWLTQDHAPRLQARPRVPVYFSGGGAWVGTGGAGVGLSGGIPFAQFDFTGGISVRF